MHEPFTFESWSDDPLGVLATTAAVMRETPWVRLDADAVRRFARARRDAAPPAHAEDALHCTDLSPERFCNYLLALEAVNFCFWDDPPRWRVTHRGATHDGYWALAAALHRAVHADGRPVWDAGWLAGLDDAAAADLFRGEGRPIPLLAERTAHLREAGRVLLERWDGAFARVVEAAGGDAATLAGRIADEFGSFRDEARWRGRPVRFHKRAQIAAADLARLLPGHRLGRLSGLERLTAFADYKLPQVMRREGILVPVPALARRIDRQEPLAAGSAEEVSLRAATVWGCQWLVRALAAGRGGARPVTAAEVDALLWSAGQDKRGLPPYHRTRTVFY